MRGKRIIILVENYLMACTGIRIKYRDIRGVIKIKFDRRHGVEFTQPLSYRGRKYLPDGLLFLKFYLTLGRMYVDIDSSRIDRKVYEIAWLLIGGNQLLVARHHRLMEIGMAHIASVDHEILQGATLARVFRTAYETAYAHHRRVSLDGDKLLVNRLAEKIDDTVLERRGEQLVEYDVIMDKLKLNVRINQSHTFKLTHYVAHLHLVTFKEFTTRRNVEKQIFHHEVTARHSGARLLADDLRAFDDNGRANGVILAHGAQLDLTHGTYRGQSLTAKTHCVECEKVFGTGNLGSTVAFESHTRIGRRHAAAVIYYLYKCTPGVLDYYLNHCGTGIDGVFHKFFNDRGGTLHHLTGGNLIGHRIGKQFDYITHYLAMFQYLLQR